MTGDEGVIQFKVHMQGEDNGMDRESYSTLEAWRCILHELGLIGRDPQRYGGLAYGNISLRDRKDTFWVSGTQTGGMHTMLPEHFTRIKSADIDGNQLWADGKIVPSSETLSHAAVYLASHVTNFVVHVHCPEVWHLAGFLELPALSRDIGYGTPAMAHAVSRQVSQQPDRGILVMCGHEDGLMSWGRCAEEATLPLIHILALAKSHLSLSRH